MLLFTALLKRRSADENLAILDDNCQQIPFTKRYPRFSEKSPKRMEKYKTSYHLKRKGKLWVNISCLSQFALVVKHQSSRKFKTIKESVQRRSLCGRQKMGSYVTASAERLLLHNRAKKLMPWIRIRDQSP